MLVRKLQSRGGEGQDSTEKRASTIEDFCARFGVGRTLVYAEIKAGRLRAKKVGRRTLIGHDDAEEWFASLPDMQDQANAWA
jgi:excisionase family DNA binding protein